MADYPARGSTNWDTSLKTYIDGEDSAEAAARVTAIAAAIADEATARNTAIAAEATARNAAITTAVNALVDGAPGALDTLKEIADQLAADESATGAILTLVTALRGLTDATFNTNLSATYAQVWKPNTTYVAGQVVIAAGGWIVERIANGVSGATFDPANWKTATSFLREVRKRVGERGSTYNNADSSMRAWHAAQARAAAGGATATVVVKGNSILQSVTTAPFNVNSWLARVQKFCDRRYGYSGEFITMMDVGGQDTRYSKTGTWVTLTNKGWVASRAASTVTAGSTATFVGKCDRMTVYYLLTTDAGSFTYSLNGAAAVTVNANGAEAIGSFTVNPALANANSLVITAPTDNTRLTILGVDMRVGATGGYRFIKAGYTGQKTQNFIGNAAAGDPLRVSRNLLAPDLTIIDLITNDYGTGTVTPLATHEANMRLLIESGLETGSVLLTLGPTPRVRVGPDGAADTPDDIPLTTSPTLAEFTDLWYRLADEYNLAIEDIQKRWGSWAQADASGYMLDYYHPNDKGNWDYAIAHFEALFQHVPGRDPVAVDTPNTWLDTQVFGHPTAASSRVRLGSTDVVTDYNGSPFQASVLATTAGGLALLAKSGQSIQLWSDILLIAGKKHNGQNGNVPAIDINVGFLRLAGTTTGSRPSAVTAAKGAWTMDTTLNIPIYSDGTNWRSFATDAIV